MAVVTTAIAGGPRRARMSPEARRHQLVTAAMPVAARAGLAGLSFDAVSGRAAVTRNLLYHYFPRGRSDLQIAVVAEAERQLNLAAQDDPLTPMVEHALAPTHAWRIHRWAVGSSDPEIRALATQAVDELVLKLSNLHLATRDPAPLAWTALRGYVAFAESALDCGRAQALARPALLRLLETTLTATLEAARG